MHPWDADPHAAGALPDLIAGRYRIVSRLGVGGMGVVYKATDLQLQRSVAIKALEERRLRLPGAHTRLRGEALAVASLDHPYICKIYELLETPTDTFIVMEFIDGETLASMLKRGTLPLAQTLQLGREIGEGLANAHARGLVHRDVKPSNVMVTPHGHVKLLDFGVAAADVESMPKDQTRTLAPQVTLHAGTPHYMAPEQASGHRITSRADLFSLGVLLYECITGKLPFSGTTTFDYVRHVIQSAPKRLDRIAPDTPAELVDLIDRCLEKNPADRPDSAETVVLALKRLQDSMTAPGSGVRTVRQAKAGRRWRMLAAAAVVIAAIVGAWRFFRPQAAPPDLVFTRRPFATTSAIESGSQISPDGNWMSFISTSGGVSRILVQRIDGGEARALTLTPGQPVSQIWSPDSNQIACVLLLDGAHLVQVYPAFFGGTPVQSVSLGATLTRVQLLRWINRDLYLRTEVSGRAGIGVGRLSLDAPSSVTPLSDAWKIAGTLNSADISPGGRAVVSVSTPNAQEDLWTLDLDGSSLQPLTSDAFFDKRPQWVGGGERVMFQSNRGGQVDLWMIDVASKALTPLTSGEGEELAESSSADGRIISFRQLSRDASLWAFTPGTAQQITQDSLSDYAPMLSGNGKVLAFQRSQPTPSRGFAILDAKVFVAPFDGKAVLDPRATADGYAPDLSRDGQWLAYLQNTDRSRRLALSVRDMRGGTVIPVSTSTALPSLMLAPVEWSARTMAWSQTGDELFFVEVTDPAETYVIRRFRTGQAAADPPFAATALRDVYLRDLYVSPQSGRLAYLGSSRERAAIYELDSGTGAVRRLATFPPVRGSDLGARGWLDREFVMLRTVGHHEDSSTSDVEILVTDGSGAPRIAGRVTRVFPGTVRLHPAKRMLYMTRVESGTHNVYALSIDTGAVTAVTQNALPGVTFSGFQPMPGGGVIGAREERREDIWVMQQSPAPDYRHLKSATRGM
jgi:serine/threonine protein kinase